VLKRPGGASWLKGGRLAVAGGKEIAKAEMMVAVELWMMVVVEV
jgi:hypothetical protein